MRKQVGKWLAALLVGSLALAGCSQNAPNSASGGAADGQNGASGEQAASRTVVTAFSSQVPRITDFNDNQLTRKLEEKLGIDIEFQTAPSDGFKDKQNLLLASGDYPAAFIGGDFSKVDQLKYGQLGVFVPLNGLIEEHAPNIRKAFEDNPWLEEGVTAPDGNIYALPGADGCYHCYYPVKTWINEEWLKTLSLELPTTTEQFEQVLKAFKTGDPNGNGKPDEVPLSGHTSGDYGSPVPFLMNAFIYTNPINYLHVIDGKVDLVADNPEWKQGLEYIRSLYEQGLIDPQTFTQNMSSIQQLAMSPGDIVLGVYANLWNGDVMTIYGEAEDQRWNQYVAVPPLRGPGGAQYATYFGDRAGEGKFAITDQATEEQQIAAIRIADYFFSEEGALDGFLGVGGWVDPEPSELGTNGEPAIFKIAPGAEDWDAPTDTLWENGFYYMPVDLFHGQAVSQDTEVQAGNEPRLYQENTKYVGHEPQAGELLPDLFIDPAQAQSVAEMATVINSYVKQNTVRFIIGEGDIASGWDAYVQGLADLKLAEYLQIYQDAYDATK